MLKPADSTSAQIQAAEADGHAQTRFHARGQAAWEHYQATGKSICADDVLRKLQEKLDARRKQLQAP